MYLRGSKWTMTRRKRRVNPWMLLGLLAMVGLFIYVDLVVVPTTQPFFIPTRTPTRDPQSFVVDAGGLFAEGKLKAAMPSRLIQKIRLIISLWLGSRYSPVNIKRHR
jgi:hypothetical protein